MVQHFYCKLRLILVAATLVISTSLMSSSRPLVDFDIAYSQLESSTTSLFSANTFETITGKKATFGEKILLKVIQKRLQRQYKKLGKKIDRYHSEECDLIILKSGDEIEAKVVEVGASEIKYRKCDHLDGPIYTKNKSEVFMIKYKNGTKEMINAQANPVTSTTAARDVPNPYEAENVNTAGGWIVGILGGLLLGLIGMLLALAFPKGPKRKAFWSGWGIGFAILMVLILAAL